MNKKYFSFSKREDRRRIRRVSFGIKMSAIKSVITYIFKKVWLFKPIRFLAAPFLELKL